MKSTYRDNYRHVIVFVPPVYNRTVKGKQVAYQALSIVVGYADSDVSARAYAKDAEQRFANRAGLIRIRKPSNVPAVGIVGRSMSAHA